VLTEPVAIADWTGFEVGRHGIVLVKGSRSRRLPADVALEQGWDREQTLDSTSRARPGCRPDGWREGAQYFVFTNHKHGGPLKETIADVGPARARNERELTCVCPRATGRRRFSLRPAARGRRHDRHQPALSSAC